MDAIEFARREEDLVKEQLLFSKLVDMLRDPDSIEKVTGKNIRARENDIYERFLKDKQL